MQRFRRIRLKSLIEATSGSRVFFEDDRSLDDFHQDRSSVTTEENGRENEEIEELSVKAEEISKESSIIAIDDASDQVRWPYSYWFAIILKVATTEMNILMDNNYSMKNAKMFATLGVLKNEKYGMKKVIDEDGVKHQNWDDRNKLKMNKQFQDGEYIMEVLKTLYKEIVDYGTFKAMQNSIEEIRAKNVYFCQLIETEALNAAHRIDLRKQLQQQYVRQKISIYNNDIVISDLHRNIDDLKLVSPICERYLESWQGARTEQHDLSMHNNRQGQVEIIDVLKLNFEREHRIHSELESYNNRVIYNTLEKLDEMSTKCDADLEELDLKVQIKKHAYLDIVEKRIALEEQFSKREEEMKKLLHYKGEIAKSQLYKNKMNNSAIVIQAWWRGLLVRLQLGPCKKKNKKKVNGYRRRKHPN